MSFFTSLYSTILDALFPVSPAEREVLALPHERVFSELPRAAPAPIRDACSIFSYKDERVRKLVWSIKYKKSKAGTALAAHALFQMLSLYARVVPHLIIVPMPISKKRRRERGFNQTEIVCDAIKALDVADRFTYMPKLLIRTRHQSRQTLKDRQERLQSAENLFAVNEKVAAKLDRTHLIIVIDDVVTTGSTISDAIATLRKAGFVNTFGMSLAH